MTRTPEQGHTRKCLASAMISVIENARDAEGFSDYEFRLFVQDNVLGDADGYLADGTQTCICPPIKDVSPLIEKLEHMLSVGSPYGVRDNSGENFD